MSLNESPVEAAALEWFPLRPSFAEASTGKPGYGGQVGELGYVLGHGPYLAPGEPMAERDSFGEVVLAGRFR